MSVNIGYPSLDPSEGKFGLNPKIYFNEEPQEFRHYLEDENDGQSLNRRLPRRISLVLERLSSWKVSPEQKRWSKSPLDRLKLLRWAGGDLPCTADGCLTGTRSGILEKITLWIAKTSADQPQVCFLIGPAAAGKTAIVHEICKRHQPMVPVGWFSFTENPDCLDTSNITTLVFTIALQLASFNGTLMRTAMDQAAKFYFSASSEARKQLSFTIHTLLVTPIKSSREAKVLILVDGLNEGTSRDGVLAFGEFARTIQGLPSVRLLISGRFGHHLKQFMAFMNSICPCLHIDLGAISKDDIDDDISLMLTAFVKNNQIPDLQDSDMIASVIPSLTALTEGSFLYAMAIMDFLSRTQTNILPKIQHLLNGKTSSTRLDLSRLDRIYLSLLNTSFPANSMDNPKMIAWIQGILGSLTVLEPPISFVILQQFSDVPVTELRKMLSSLRAHSIIIETNVVQKNTDAQLLPMHRSTIQNLRSNACTSQTLRYACTYWRKHLSKANLSPKLLALLEVFLSGDVLLIWLQTMELLGELETALVDLNIAHTWYKKNCATYGIKDDVLRIVEERYSLILNANDFLHFPREDDDRKRSLKQLYAVEDIYLCSLARRTSFRLGTDSIMPASSVVSWAESTSCQEHICLLLGDRNSGKSEIAFRVADQLEKMSLLGACLFFASGLEGLNSTQLLFQSITQQLSLHHEDLRPHLKSAMLWHLSQPHRRGMVCQIEDLVLKPLEKFDETRSPLVIVIDSIDTATLDMKYVIYKMSLLYLVVKSVPFPLRLVVTASTGGPLHQFLIKIRGDVHIIHVGNSDSHAGISAAPNDLSDEITRETTVQKGGGGFADIYKGNIRETKIAVKVIRSHVYSEDTQWKIDKRENLSGFGAKSLYGQDYGIPTSFLFWIDWGCHKILEQANILVNKGVAVLADFGLSYIVAEFHGTSFMSSTIAGASRWAAPELYQFDNVDGDPSTTTPSISKKCDIYSLGSIILQCWIEDPLKRPETAEVRLQIIRLHSDYTPEDLSKRLDRFQKDFGQMTTARMDQAEQLPKFLREIKLNTASAMRQRVLRPSQVIASDPYSEYNQTFLSGIFDVSQDFSNEFISRKTPSSRKRGGKMDQQGISKSTGLDWTALTSLKQNTKGSILDYQPIIKGTRSSERSMPSDARFINVSVEDENSQWDWIIDVDRKRENGQWESDYQHRIPVPIFPPNDCN
ncbi:hypothetical protein BDQ12DRAFT_756053 [Crucibulum laeve]|uniref:Protein kinase domain-containing protein n=1 Tax=Crucibulum laeve TaxID=68775 RepID=A0A5C3M566_9AGAR|nr:hypothetical protein BDQ12DRAFT_756053 [Crucibulum laeve]